jgi:predicted MFS family arabinose efflux permease
VQTVLLAAALSGLTLPVWWGAIAAARGYELVTFATMNTVNAAVGFAAGTWLAVYVQRLDRRYTMVVLGLVMSVTELLTIVAVQPMAFFAVRSVNAAALALTGILGLVYLGYTRDPAKSYGWYTTLQAAIQSVGLLLVPIIATRLGFTALQLALVLPGLVVATLSWRLPPAAPPQVQAMARGSLREQLTSLPWRAALPAVAAALAFNFYTSDFFGYSERFGNARQIDAERIGLILSLTAAAGIPASLFVSWIGSRIGLIKPIVAGSAFGVVSVLLLLAPQYGEPGYWAAMIVFSLVWSFVLPYLYTMIGQIEPSGRLLIATQPIRQGINVVLAGAVAGAVATGGLKAVALLALTGILLCPVFAAIAMAMHRKAGVAGQALIDRPSPPTA